MHDANLLEDQPFAWTPTPEVIERAQLTRFMRQVGVSTWDELYEFSIRDVERFTEEVLKFLDIKFDPPYEKLLDTSNGVEFPTWFSRNADIPVRMEQRDADTPVRMSVAATRTGAGDDEGSIGSESFAGGTGDADRNVRVPDADRNVRVPSAGLNITEMCLDRWQTDEMKDQPAVIWEGEEGEPEELTYEELFEEVEEVAEGLRVLGFGKGDAIGIHLPMLPETVVVLLAINRIGAIAVPVFSGYGVEAISSRLNAVKARGLFTCEGFQRRGKVFDAYAISSEAVKSCPTIEHVFVVERMVGSEWDPDERVVNDEQAIFYHELIDIAYDSEDEEWAPEPTSAEDPLIILYTSGTTGKPKGIAHTHASFPIKAAQDMAFGTDVGRGTRICWYTDIGWMMGPWLIYGALINGATICLYDGAPDHPTRDRMWEFCARHKVEILGIAPTLVRSLAAQEERNADTPVRVDAEQRNADTPVRTSVAATRTGAGDDEGSMGEDGIAGGTGDADRNVRVPISGDADRNVRGPDADRNVRGPWERHDLSSLRAFASSGEPWNPGPWWWLFEKVGNSKIPIINYSGGTEISGGILMGNPLLPQKPCSFPAPCPGMDADILDENGQPVEAGKVGELVLKQPWIGMARGFWQERERYLDTYWRRFENIWVHGDWAMRDRDGHWFILGRSDDTLKVAGKRVGPAEVESLLVAHPDVTEAAVIGVPDEVKGTAMVAFVVVTGGQASLLAAEEEASRMLALQSELKTLVARDMGKPLAPSKIHFVSALPKTRNAKVMRRVIRSAYLGEDAGDLSALEDPRSIEAIRNARDDRD